MVYGVSLGRVVRDVAPLMTSREGYHELQRARDSPINGVSNQSVFLLKSKAREREKVWLPTYVKNHMEPAHHSQPLPRNMFSARLEIRYLGQASTFHLYIYWHVHPQRPRSTACSHLRCKCKTQSRWVQRGMQEERLSAQRVLAQHTMHSALRDCLDFAFF